VGAPGTGKAALALALVSKLNHPNETLTVAVVDNTTLMAAIVNADLALLTSVDTEDTQSKYLHQQLRTILATYKLPYAVIYGDEQARTQAALDAVAHHLKQPTVRSDHDTVWRWMCETCADAQCEHRLFSQLR
jgi:hypothetical protein